ncbi:MAG: YabP/YqfC family sporulation protein [Clostridia bacterium]
MKNTDNFAGTVTEIYNNKKIIIDGCDGIIDFSDDEIILKSGRLKLTIVGKNLEIILLSDNKVVAKGYISSVNYSYF